MKFTFIFLCLLLSFTGRAAVTPWVDFTLSNGHIYLPITIEGVDTYLLLDSGAEINAINSAFVKKHNLKLGKGSKVRVQGIHETERRPSYNNVKTEFFDNQFEFDRVVDLDLGHHSVGMLLSAGFFSHYIMQIDYPNQKIRLITRDSLDLSKISNIPSQFEKGHGMPIVQIEIEGRLMWLLLDTGNNGGIYLERRYARKTGLLEKQLGELEIAGVNSSATSQYAVADNVKFGPVELESVMVNIPAAGQRTNLSSQFSETGSRIKGKKVSGIIGYDMLKHFIVTIDLKTGKVHLALP